MGRSKGGLTSKLHVVTNEHGTLVALKLTGGQANDGRAAADMMGSLGQGDVLLADRAYDSDALRAQVMDRLAFPCIRPMPQRRADMPFDWSLYAKRNVVERFFNKLKHFRAIATRYDKRDDNFIASVKLAAIRIQLRTMSP